MSDNDMERGSAREKSPKAWKNPLAAKAPSASSTRVKLVRPPKQSDSLPKERHSESKRASSGRSSWDEYRPSDRNKVHDVYPTRNERMDPRASRGVLEYDDDLSPRVYDRSRHEPPPSPRRRSGGKPRSPGEISEMDRHEHRDRSRRDRKSPRSRSRERRREDHKDARSETRSPRWRDDSRYSYHKRDDDYRSRRRSPSPRASKRPRHQSPYSPIRSAPVQLVSLPARPDVDWKRREEIPTAPRWGGPSRPPPPHIAVNGKPQPLRSPSVSPPPPPDTPGPGTPDEPPPPPPPDSPPPPIPGTGPASNTPNLSQAPPAPNRNLLDPPSRLASPKLSAFAPRRQPARRDDEAEMVAYGKTFVGCGKLQHYDVGRKLGEGTFGVVTRAVHKETKVEVALKKIILHNEKDGLPITALREIKILKKMRHPNVVSVLDMVVDRDHPGEDGRATIFMVFPYMDHDLCGLLENTDFKNTHSLVKLYMKQLLEGTAYLHANKILHRDMKAANLLVNNKGVLMIADFGLARPFSLPTITQAYGEQPKHSAAEYTNMVVTRWYRPPELLLGQTKYGPEIDMWGVGCVFGEMHHRKPILAGESDAEQLNTIFRLCGSPNEVTLPGWDELPGFEGQKKDWSRPLRPRRVIEWASNEQMPPLYADLLDKLLVLNPAQRLTALEALEHPYFYTDPLPAKIGEVPTIDSSHEYTKRKRQSEAQAHAQAKLAASQARDFRPPQFRPRPPFAQNGFQNNQYQRPPWPRPPPLHAGPPPGHPHNFPPPNLAPGIPPPSFPLAGRPPPFQSNRGGVPPPPFALSGGQNRPPHLPVRPSYQPPPPRPSSYGQGGLDYGS